MLNLNFLEGAKLARKVGLVSPYANSNHLAPTMPAKALATAGFFIF